MMYGDGGGVGVGEGSRGLVEKVQKGSSRERGRTFAVREGQMVGGNRQRDSVKGGRESGTGICKVLQQRQGAKHRGSRPDRQCNI